VQGPGRDWRTILLGIASLGCSLIAFAFASLIIVYTLFGLITRHPPQNDPTTLQDFIIASGLSFIGVVLLPAAYYSLKRSLGEDIPKAAPKLLKIWQGVLLLFVWLGVAGLAQLFAEKNILKWFTPLFYLLAIGTPVYILVRLASGGLNAGSRQRFWGAATTSIILSITLSIVAEGILILIGLAGVAGYLAFQPGQLATFKHIADQIANASSDDSAFNALGPLINNPLVFVIALLFFSGFTPVIEETAKSLAAWTIFDRLETPAQGFVIGALSGAGFGFVESLLASATPDSSWAATLLIRGGSTMMHIMAASLTGWGIASLRNGKTRIESSGRFIAMYGVAFFLHGLWNASVVLIAFGTFQAAPLANGSDPLGLVLMIAGASVLIILCCTIPIALGIINKHFRMTVPNNSGSPIEENPKFQPTIAIVEKGKEVQ
jgi:RsiW-degrading membrane proteinase PrsW (M82 family)